MATTPSHRSSRSAASSTSVGRNSLLHARDAHAHAPAQESSADSIPLETLVEHLLAAKQSLSSMDSLLRANEIITAARQSHEEAVILSAGTDFLRHAISDQTAILNRVKRSLLRTYELGKREFDQLIKMMDHAGESLKDTIGVLKATTVQAAFRPKDEEPKNLMDFVDEKSMHGMIEALENSIQELRAIQKSFDGDILRFETDIRNLKKAATSPPPSPSSERYQSIPLLLESLIDHSHGMATSLTSLTRHFDLCVTAVRITEGGAALARRKAAEVTQSNGAESVSISGVIAEQESQGSELDPVTSQDRADIIRIVVDDAAQVDGEVLDIKNLLQSMESQFKDLNHQVGLVRRSHDSTLQAFRALEDIGSKMPSYVAAEAEFLARWEQEKSTIFARLEEMDQLRSFYENYANAYDSLLLEVERRRMVEEKIQTIWRKAQESVDKLTEGDRGQREAFMQDAGEFLPTDLWHGMSGSTKRWEVRSVRDGEGSGQLEQSTPALTQSVVDAARQRVLKTR